MRGAARSRSQQRNNKQAPVGYQPVLLMPQQRQPMMMQPVYQYVPQPVRARNNGANAGGIHQKMRQTKQQVRNAPIESRVQLANQKRPSTPQRGNGNRTIEDRLRMPKKSNAVPSPQRNNNNSNQRAQQQQVNRRQTPQQQQQAKKTLRLNPQSKRIQKEPVRSKAQAAANQGQNRAKQAQTNRLAAKKITLNPKKQSQQAQKTGSAQKASASKQDGLPMLGKNMILPVPNPTGNPYDRPALAKINDVNELKGLQVKAELDKLGKPSRAFSEYLLLENDATEETNQMEDCATLGSATKQTTISERFSRIERARPAVHPITIQLARKLKNLQDKPAPSSPVKNNPESSRQQNARGKSSQQNNNGRNNMANSLTTTRKQNRYRK